MNSISQECSELLVQGLRYAPLYGNRLANHLPMALVALDRLGASPAAMREFATRYAQRLVPAGVACAVLDPHDYLGSSGDQPRFVRFFEERIGESGARAVLEDWVPVLMPGLAASAFHAMIRLAYAVEAGGDEEIAHALAYWASEYVTLPFSLDTTADPLDQIAARLRASVAGHVFKPGIIIDKMQEIAWHPALAGVPVQTALAPGLRDIARFALDAYWRQEDFTLLHVVTGCHAFRLLQPFVHDGALARRYLWQAVVAAWLTVAPSTEADPAPDCVQNCDAAGGIALLATRASDDHVIKLCYSALCEHREYGDPRYLQAACRKLARAGLLAPAAQQAC
jgi:hypothetical protein